ILKLINKTMTLTKLFQERNTDIPNLLKLYQLAIKIKLEDTVNFIKKSVINKIEKIIAIMTNKEMPATCRLITAVHFLENILILAAAFDLYDFFKKPISDAALNLFSEASNNNMLCLSSTEYRLFIERLENLNLIDNAALSLIRNAVEKMPGHFLQHYQDTENEFYSILVKMPLHDYLILAAYVKIDLEKRKQVVLKFLSSNSNKKLSQCNDVYFFDLLNCQSLLNDNGILPAILKKVEANDNPTLECLQAFIPSRNIKAYKKTLVEESETKQALSSLAVVGLFAQENSERSQTPIIDFETNSILPLSNNQL
ncbi:MAG TPA: hypothetical protein VJL60_01620, partial [Gammaproteobacteria bacterium]|nr:hypothetical protein [Gammaproteobacteria bacterium]